MCLAAFAFGISRHRLVFAANRDELHDRPAAGARWWQDQPQILGGRDLSAGGTWLGVDRQGRLAAVTNGPSAGRKFPKSRGHLVSDFLAQELSAETFLDRVAAESASYGPFHLLLFDADSFCYFSNQGGPIRLSPGVYALSNAPLGTPWPKMRFAEAALKASLADEDPESRLFEMLDTRETQEPTRPGEVPGRHRDRIFVQGERFGTRSSTVVLISGHGEVRFVERRHRADGARENETAFRFTQRRSSASEASG